MPLSQQDEFGDRDGNNIQQAPITVSMPLSQQDEFGELSK